MGPNWTLFASQEGSDHILSTKKVPFLIDRSLIFEQGSSQSFSLWSLSKSDVSLGWAITPYKDTAKARPCDGKPMTHQLIFCHRQNMEA